MIFFTRRGKAGARVNYVEWLKGTGTQYFDLGIVGKTGVTVEIDFMVLSGDTTDLIVAGCCASGYSPRFYIAAAQSGKFAYGYGEWENSSMTFELNERYKVKTELLSGLQKMTVNGTVLLTGTNTTAYNIGHNIYLFGINQFGSYRSYGELVVYSCRVWENSVLIRDRWPCYDPDGVPAMYDEIDGKYYYNNGSGEFGTPEAEPETDVALGTVWAYTSNGTFEVPATGKYQVEMHGGGGGGVLQTGSGTFDSDVGGFMFAYAGGGGSGEVYTVTLTKGDVHSVTIGAGGASGSTSGATGGTTTFGSYSIAGGGGGKVSGMDYTVGAASGSLATAGSGGRSEATTSSLAGGQGNKNNTAQTYGDGGSSTHKNVGSSNSVSNTNGKAGAVIITYLGT